MCVIVVSENGTIPTHEQLLSMQSHNRDGIGIGWRNPRDNLVHFRRGITLLEAEKWLKLCADNTYAYILHFRFATVGGISPRLCHPFPMTCDQRLLFAKSGTTAFVLAQNGHWSSWEAEPELPAKKRRRHAFSDTAALAYIAASVRNTIIIPNNNKIVTLQGSGPQESTSTVSPCEAHGPLKMWGYWQKHAAKAADGTDDAARCFYSSNNFWVPAASYPDSTYSSSHRRNVRDGGFWPHAAQSRVKGVFYDNYECVVQTKQQLAIVRVILTGIEEFSEYVDMCSFVAPSAAQLSTMRHTACPKRNVYACEHGNYFDCDVCPQAATGMPFEVLPTTEAACKDGQKLLNAAGQPLSWGDADYKNHVRPTYRWCGLPLGVREHGCQHSGHQHCSECSMVDCVKARDEARPRTAAWAIGKALSALGRQTYASWHERHNKRCDGCSYYNGYHQEKCPHYPGSKSDTGAQLRSAGDNRLTARGDVAARQQDSRNLPALYGNAPDCLNKANPSWCIAGLPCVNCIAFRRDQAAKEANEACAECGWTLGTHNAACSKFDHKRGNNLARNRSGGFVKVLSPAVGCPECRGLHKTHAGWCTYNPEHDAPAARTASIRIDGDSVCVHDVDLNVPCAQCDAGIQPNGHPAPYLGDGIVRRFVRSWRNGGAR